MRNDIKEIVLGAIDDIASTTPKEGQSWESWFHAAFDLAGRNVAEIIDRRNSKQDTVFVRFNISTAKGEFLPSVSLEVLAVKWHGMTDGGMLWDITHLDGTQERIKVESQAYGDFNLEGSSERIMEIYVTSFSYPVLTKGEFRERFGTGMLLHPTKKHFVRPDQMPDFDQPQ